MGLKDQILGSEDLTYEDHEVPEWDGAKVRVRGMSGSDRDAYEAKAVAVRKGTQDVELRLQDYRSRLLVKCLFDPASDKRIFSGSDSDIKALGAKSGVVIDRLFDVARRLSGMDNTAVEDARGNSKAAPSGSSTSD